MQAKGTYRASATSPPAAAVIIPHYNDTIRLRRCLQALVGHELSEIEIVVVDNGSSEPLDALIADFPEVRFLREAEKGAAAARNRGVAETTAPLLFFTDADCVPAGDWIMTARKRAGMADIVGGRVDVFDETPPPRSGVEAFETVFAFHNRSYVEQRGFSVTANLLTRREVFVETGTFRPGLSEDRDWCLRATARGYRIAYADDLRVSHPTRQDWAGLRRKWLRLTQETWGLQGRGPVARGRWALRALATAASGVGHQPRIWLSPDLAGAGDRWRGAVVLLRIRGLRAFWMLRQALGGQI